MQKMLSKMEVAPPCTQNRGWEERWSVFENFLLFWFSGISRKFSRNFNFSRILEKFHFSISISRHFHFTYHFSKRLNQIFISLFTSQKKWIRFSFHFSLLELSISTLTGHWSSQPYSHHNKHSLVIAFVVKNCHHSLIWAMVSYH